LGEKLALRFKTVREAFQHYDQDLSGSIEENEFRDCSACPSLSTPAFSAPSHAQTLTSDTPSFTPSASASLPQWS